jgi:hypothetical protein
LGEAIDRLPLPGAPGSTITCDEPHLGLATTEQLFRELIARFEGVLLIDQSSGVSITRMKHIAWALQLSEMLGGIDKLTREYRTVGDK